MVQICFRSTLSECGCFPKWADWYAVKMVSSTANSLVTCSKSCRRYPHSFKFIIVGHGSFRLWTLVCLTILWMIIDLTKLNWYSFWSHHYHWKLLSTSLFIGLLCILLMFGAFRHFLHILQCSKRFKCSGADIVFILKLSDECSLLV